MKYSTVALLVFFPLLVSGDVLSIKPMNWNGVVLCESTIEDAIKALGEPSSVSTSRAVWTYDQLDLPLVGIGRNYRTFSVNFTSSFEGRAYKMGFVYDEMGFPFSDLRKLAYELGERWFGTDAIARDTQLQFDIRPKYAELGATAIYVSRHPGVAALSMTNTDCDRISSKESGFN